MKKLATLLLTSAVAGGLVLSSVAPSSADSSRYAPRGNYAGQQVQNPQGRYWNQDQDWTRGQGRNFQGPQGQMAYGQGPQQGYGVRGQANGVNAGFGAGILRLACSVDGAPRMEIALNNLNSRLTLSEEQKTLFDSFKTAALTAQTGYADACKLPSTATTAPNPVENLKLYETNATARIAAINDVLPSLEAFYNSLSDAQKAAMQVGPRANMQVGQGQYGNNGQRFDRRGMGPGMMFNQNNAAPNQGNFVPGQGMGPGNGQGFGPRNNS